VEQPIQTIPIDPSPLKHHKNSVPHSPNPMSPLTPPCTYISTHAEHDARRSTHLGAPLCQTKRCPAREVPSRSGSSESQSSSSLIPDSSRSEQRELFVHNTESVRALLDVELAIDENLLAEAAQRAAIFPQRLSTSPRLSEIENPFIDLAARLGSRRVRPMAIELIQALGHYIDAVWYLAYPGTPCSWIATTADSGRRWTSRMITAVQEGKVRGHVNTSPTVREVAFWAEEVRFGLREVDEVVGIYKGVGWAFSTAMLDGGYGEISAPNALGEDGKGGNLARLLNDLEEAIWYVPRFAVYIDTDVSQG